MKTIDIILGLIQKENITEYRVTKECNLPTSAFAAWKSGKQKPSLDALIKIADYFNVSLDYLVGRNPKSDLDVEKAFRQGEKLGHYLAQKDS